MCEELETLTQPGPSGYQQTAKRNKDQAKPSISVNFDKVIEASSSNKKRSYEDLHHNSIPGSSKKRNYEELSDDISDLLGTNVSGIACNKKL